MAHKILSGLKLTFLRDIIENVKKKKQNEMKQKIVTDQNGMKQNGKGQKMTDQNIKAQIQWKRMEWIRIEQHRMKQNRKGQKMIDQSVKEWTGMEQNIFAHIHYIKGKQFLVYETFLRSVTYILIIKLLLSVLMEK